MSKAFTREADSKLEDEPSEPIPGLPKGVPNYITPVGHACLCNEMEYLIRIDRPKVVETVAWAASNGDRSENGDYIYGKKRLREIDRRLRFLTKRLEIAQVVDPALQAGNDQVFFGATVTVNDESGVSQTYRIVGVDEIDPARGHISWISPLARALLKLREGDLARFQSPAGPRELQIMEVRYESDALPDR